MSKFKPWALSLGLVIAVMWLPSCVRKKPTSHVTSAGLMMGGFRGVEAVDRAIQGRIDPYGFFRLNQYLLYSSDLVGLMGGYPTFTLGTTTTLENITPNAVNTMLWKIAMSSLTESLAEKICSKDNVTSILDGTFVSVATPICNQPVTAVTVDQLRSLWLRVMRFDAPETEVQAWIDDVIAAKNAAPTTAAVKTIDLSVQQSDVDERKSFLSELLLSIFMNPYFLLEH